MNFDIKHFFLSVINFDLMNINELPWKFIIVKFHGFSFVKGKTKDKLKQLSLGQTPTLYPFPVKNKKFFPPLIGLKCDEIFLNKNSDSADTRPQTQFLICSCSETFPFTFIFINTINDSLVMRRDFQNLWTVIPIFSFYQ